jgi:hypothetical protein
VTLLAASKSAPAEAAGARFGPQTAFRRQWFAQHWLAYEQAWPSGRQDGFAQSKLTHDSVGAQSAAVRHGYPRELGAHRLPTQSPVQQADGDEQAWYAGVH